MLLLAYEHTHYYERRGNCRLFRQRCGISEGIRYHFIGCLSMERWIYCWEMGFETALHFTPGRLRPTATQQRGGGLDGWLGSYSLLRYRHGAYVLCSACAIFIDLSISIFESLWRTTQQNRSIPLWKKTIQMTKENLETTQMDWSTSESHCNSIDLWQRVLCALKSLAVPFILKERGWRGPVKRT